MRNLKILALSLFAAVTMTAWGENANQEDEKYPEITFEKTTIDFGLFDREHGDKTCYFVFTNTGNKELMILNATATCGCTEPEYPKTPIQPGMKDSIKVTYNGSTRRVGVMKKTIALTTNCKVNSSYIYIQGEMVEELVADRVKPEEQK
jgi:hypothetical protein